MNYSYRLTAALFVQKVARFWCNNTSDYFGARTYYWFRNAKWSVRITHTVINHRTSVQRETVRATSSTINYFWAIQLMYKFSQTFLLFIFKIHQHD
jgi:hypothetical protein